MNKLHGLVIFLVFVHAKAYPCSCAPPEPSRIDSYASDVFVAKALSSQSYLSFTKNRIVFSLTSVLKGEPSNKILLWTPKSEAACGRSYVKGKEYLIYLSPGDNSVGLCSSLKMDSEYHKAYIKNIFAYYNSNKPINYAPSAPDILNVVSPQAAGY
ncbi:hypothetical protein C3B51_22845 [Pseudoalteromonas rubra]|uniref:NTR domain-containing protein n=1 Tax=Pseudoalteromonas rubra TaxID=43658 RepID=A0A4Q7DYH9_9GAMM|nr:hypothetical protein [Pseudoalteromonas rubra]RZM71090.1 hypothetical protein C3B51_22845 [Pseudoalteromonas rubra]